MKILLSIVLLLNIMIGCNRQTSVDSKGKIRKEVKKDTLGRLTAELNYIEDSLLHGLIIYYYPNGQISEQIMYNRGIIDGWDIAYWEDGRLKSKILYSIDVLNGFAYLLKDNTESYKQYKKRAVQFRDAIYFYSNGTKELYNAIDYFDNAFCILQWDSLGNCVQNDGFVFSPNILFNQNKDSVSLRSKLEIKFNVAMPPESKTCLKAGLINDLASDIDTLDIKDYVARYSHTFTSHGKYKLYFVGEIKDMQGVVQQKDSIITEITVIP